MVDKVRSVLSSFTPVGSCLVQYQPCWVCLHWYCVPHYVGVNMGSNDVILGHQFLRNLLAYLLVVACLVQLMLYAVFMPQLT